MREEKKKPVSWASLSLVIAETIKPYMIIIVLDGENQKEEGCNWFHGGISSENTKKKRKKLNRQCLWGRCFVKNK